MRKEAQDRALCVGISPLHRGKQAQPSLSFLRLSPIVLRRHTHMAITHASRPQVGGVAPHVTELAAGLARR